MAGPVKFATFDGTQGRDHHGNPLWVEEGYLWRDGVKARRCLVDFRDMEPQQVLMPQWAKSW